MNMAERCPNCGKELSCDCGGFKSDSGIAEQLASKEQELAKALSSPKVGMELYTDALKHIKELNEAVEAKMRIMEQQRDKIKELTYAVEANDTYHEITTLKNEIASLKAELKNEQHDWQKARDEIEGLHSKVADLKAKIAKAKKAIDKMDFAKESLSEYDYSWIVEALKALG